MIQRILLVPSTLALDSDVDQLVAKLERWFNDADIFKATSSLKDDLQTMVNCDLIIHIPPYDRREDTTFTVGRGIYERITKGSVDTAKHWIYYPGSSCFYHVLSATLDNALNNYHCWGRIHCGPARTLSMFGEQVMRTHAEKQVTRGSARKSGDNPYLKGERLERFEALFNEPTSPSPSKPVRRSRRLLLLRRSL